MSGNVVPVFVLWGTQPRGAPQVLAMADAAFVDAVPDMWQDRIASAVAEHMEFWGSDSGPWTLTVDKVHVPAPEPPTPGRIGGPDA